MRWLLLVALVSTGCSGAGGTTDASAMTDGSDVDAPHASFRVVERASLFTLVPAAGFSFRAETADGQVIEGTIDAHGWAPPSLDALSGPWDLTLARQHHAAVSILGIDGPLHGDVMIPLSVAEVPTHTLTVSVDGISDLGASSIVVCPPGWLQTDGAHVQCVEGSSLDVWAIQRAGNIPSEALVNFAHSGPLALDAADTSVVLHMPSPPPTVVRSTVRVQFPSTGLVTADGVPNGDGYERAWRGGDDEQRCAAANVSWAAPDASGVGTWTIDTFDVEGTQPTTLAVPGGAVQIHTVTDGALVTIAPVTSTPELVDDAGWPRVRSNASEVDYVRLSAGTGEANVHAQWDAYGLAASITDHRLPSLPTGITVADLIQGYGFGAVTTLVAQACGLRIASGPPWAPGASLDLIVCEPSASVRFGSP